MLPNKSGWWTYYGAPRLIEKKNGKFGWWVRLEQKNKQIEAVWSNGLTEWPDGITDSTEPTAGWQNAKWLGPFSTAIRPEAEEDYFNSLKQKKKQVWIKEIRKRERKPIFWKF